MSNTKKIAILGYGAEGKAVFEFIQTLPEYQGAEIWILDKNPLLSLPSSIRSMTGDTYLDSLDTFDTVFRSPGVPFSLSEIQNAQKHGVEISSATDLFFRLFKGTIIGVTGTKGKGTTSTLIYEILKASGKDAYLAGNVGTPAVNILPHLTEKSVVVLELSSFQLQGLAHSPHTAVVLGLFPDHMDKHSDMDEYVDAKRNIVLHQKNNDFVFYVSNNAFAKSIAESSLGTRVPITPDALPPLPFLREDLHIIGQHNYLNAAIASIVCQHLGVADKVIRSAVQSFRGLQYRIQFVREINVEDPEYPRGSVRIYNDSASTNPQTTIAGIRSFSDPIVLITGGRNKGLDYTPLANALCESTVSAVVLFGESKEQLRTLFSPIVSCVAVDTLREAVMEAVKQSQSGDIILFSPGAESFDMFKNYKDRGAQFDEIVEKIKEVKP